MKREVKLKIHRVDIFVVKDVALYYEEERDYLGFKLLISNRRYYWDSVDEKVRYENTGVDRLSYIVDKENRCIYADSCMVKFMDDATPMDYFIRRLNDMENVQSVIQRSFLKAFDEDFCLDQINQRKEMKKQQDEEYRVKMEKRRLIEEEKEKENIKRLKDIQMQMMNGDKVVKVESEDLLDIFKMNNIKLPLRTHGSISSNVYYFFIKNGKTQSAFLVKGKSFSWNTLDKAFLSLLG